jgi:hypothetical protein
LISPKFNLFFCLTASVDLLSYKTNDDCLFDQKRRFMVKHRVAKAAETQRKLRIFNVPPSASLHLPVSAFEILEGIGLCVVALYN